MDPIIAGLLSMAPGVAKSIFGIGQGMRARDLAKMERPTREMPTGIEEMLANARMMAGLTELPGQDRMEQKIASSTAGGLSAAKQVSGSSASTLGALSDIYGKEMGSLADLEGMAANFWAGNQGQLQGALGEYGQWQDKMWQWNKGQPYLQAMDAAKQLNMASPINTLTGFSEAIGGGMAGYGGQQLTNTFDDILNELKQYWSNLPGGEGGNNANTSTSTTGAPKSLMDLLGLEGSLFNKNFDFYGSVSPK